MGKALSKLIEPMFGQAKVFVLMAVFASMLFTLSAATTQTVSTQLCSMVMQVENVIFILALALMILGGTLYASAHLLPSQQRGALQGYGMGMIFGGVIGTILVLLAPYILSTILGFSSTTGSGFTTCSGIFGF